MLTDYNDALYKLDSLSVHVMLNEVVKRLVPEARVKSRFELVLGRHNIRADDKAPVWLVINYEGVWNDNGTEIASEIENENENVREPTLSYVAVMSVQQEVTIERKNDWRRTAAIVWQKLACGYSDRSIAEEVLMRDVEAMAESFAANYSTVQEKIK
jgi:hypothetical protein